VKSEKYSCWIFIETGFIGSEMSVSKILDPVMEKLLKEIKMNKAVVFSLFLTFLAFTSSAQPTNPVPVPEYHPAEAVVIRYPFNSNIWPLYADLINACQGAATTVLLVNNETEGITLRNLLSDANIPSDNIRITQIPASRMWVRDHGPLTIKSDEGKTFINFRDYNNSGHNDQVLTVSLANHWGFNHFSHNWILDGGNYMVDSHGRLFTTTRLYTNNPSVAPATINQVLENYLGITEIITVSPQHDDYWGHIDMQMKLLNDTTIVISSVEQGSGSNFAVLEANVQIIQNLTAPGGRPYNIVRLPKALNWKTYTNALILNNKVIIPTYNHPNDQIALNAYAELMPDHTIVGVNCNPIIGWGGAIHCITIQVHADPATFLLQIEVVGQGKVFFNGEEYLHPENFEEGTVVQLEAIPAEGQLFSGWSGAFESSENPIEVTVNKPLEIVANFRQDNTSIDVLYEDISAPRIYHNPTTNVILVEQSGGFITGQFKLFNAAGSLISTNQIKDPIDRVCTSSLRPGVYLYLVTLANGSQTSGKLFVR